MIDALNGILWATDHLHRCSDFSESAQTNTIGHARPLQEDLHDRTNHIVLRGRLVILYDVLQLTLTSCEGFQLQNDMTNGRTIRCTEVADRPFPDGTFLARDIGDRGRYV